MVKVTGWTGPGAVNVQEELLKKRGVNEYGQAPWKQKAIAVIPRGHKRRGNLRIIISVLVSSR